MRFERLDLNLLVVLDALLTERNVSLAAERICLSQSATSSALGRLREYFGDELLLWKGRSMVLSARGEALAEPVHRILEQIRDTISVPPLFDPGVSDRTIRIMASDYITEVLLSTMLHDMESLAPQMRFEVWPIAEANETLERGAIDILISIDYALAEEHPKTVLFEDDYVVVGWEGNPDMQSEMTQDLFFKLGHVTPRFGRSRMPAFDDWFLKRQTKLRRVEIVTGSFLSVPSLVSNSNRIATLQRRLARCVASQHRLVIKPPPFEIPSIRVAAQWHISKNNDTAVRWVVERLVAVSARSSNSLMRVEEGHTDSASFSLDEIAEQYRACSARKWQHS